MLGFLAARAATGAVGAATKNGTPANEVKPTPCHPFAITIVIGILVFIVLTSLHGVNPLITPLSIVAGLVVLGGIFASGVSDARKSTQALKAMPNPEDKLHEAQAFRAAMERRAAAPAITRPAPSPEPAPVDARATTPAPPRPRLTTLAEIRADELDNERCTRMAHIMMAECPVCTAPGAGFCAFHPGQEVTILDKDRGIIVHTARIGRAIKTRNADVEDVKAQFNGKIPAKVWEYAL